VLKRLLLAAIIIFSVVAGVAFYFLEREWVDVSLLEIYPNSSSSVILDESGEEFARFDMDRRRPVSFDKLPLILVQAIISTEDHDFFNHAGISLKGMMRSALVNLYHRRIVQGASTITQQLAKLMFLSYDRTFYRKIQELFLALHLEQQLSKQQIFELYVNNIYFGRGIYGVDAACKRFWNKPLSEMTIDEAATLAAVAKSARFYSPLNAPETAKIRRNIVLKSMSNLGFITEDEYQNSLKLPIKIVDNLSGSPIRLYIQEWIRTWAETKFGKEALYTKGLKIKTTLNAEMQTAAEQAYIPVIRKLQETHGQNLNSGFISIEASTGKIKALIGGLDFKKSQYNRVFQARRQMGSSFKPILYAFAMTKGFQLDSVFIDEPIEMTMPNGQVWTPKNWNDKFEGAMTLARALTYSNNIITVKLYMQLYQMLDWMSWIRKFGITAEIQPYPSSALGTAEITPEDNCAAFNVFANNGVYVKPYLIESVKDEHGIKIWEAEPEKHRAIDTRTASIMVNALSHRMVFNKQSVGEENWINADTIGKSGSTNGAASTWFVGSTPNFTTAVYIGRDDNKPMGQSVFARETALPIWFRFNKSINHEKKHFQQDSDLKEVVINWSTGEREYKTPYRDADTIKILKY